MYEDHYPSRALFCFMPLGTALHKAAELRKVDVVRYLVNEGANLSIKDANRRTALEYEQMLNQWEVIQALKKGNYFVFSVPTCCCVSVLDGLVHAFKVSLHLLSYLSAMTVFSLRLIIQWPAKD